MSSDGKQPQHLGHSFLSCEQLQNMPSAPPPLPAPRVLLPDPDAANRIAEWGTASPAQCKHSERRTYIDDVQRCSRKQGLPAPSHYDVSHKWAPKSAQKKGIADRVNFMDTCQYEADRTPGPGAYPLSTLFRPLAEHKVPDPHHPRQPKDHSAADMTTYHPCAVEYNTFARLEKLGKAPPKNNKKEEPKKSAKENVPGPGAYRMINAWKGKTKGSDDQLSYLNAIYKGSSPSVYH